MIHPASEKTNITITNQLHLFSLDLQDLAYLSTCLALISARPAASICGLINISGRNHFNRCTELDRLERSVVSSSSSSAAPNPFDLVSMGCWDWLNSSTNHSNCRTIAAIHQSHRHCTIRRCLWPRCYRLLQLAGRIDFIIRFHARCYASDRIGLHNMTHRLIMIICSHNNYLTPF